MTLKLWGSSAPTGQILPISDTNYEAGFYYLGNNPPTAEEFNWLFQQVTQGIIDAGNLWQANKAYTVGNILRSNLLTNSNKYFECTTAGTSGTTEPTWGAVGTTVTDGTAAWTIRDVRDTRALRTARTINGVSFDGSANIAIPASAISSTATGDVAATNVQAAIADLALDKLAIDNSKSNVRVIRDVVTYYGAGPVIGIIKITFPALALQTALRFNVIGFNNVENSNSAWEAIISGIVSSSKSWVSTSAILSPNCPFTSVRFGYDDTNPCIFLGSITTTYINPVIRIPEIQAHSSGVSALSANWSISVITTETGVTFNATPTTKTLATVENVYDKATSDANYLPRGTTVVTGDWNNYVNNSFAYGLNLANAPTSGSTHWYWVQIIRYANDYTYQQAHGFGGAAQISWERTQNLGVWSAWKRIATADQIPSATAYDSSHLFADSGYQIFSNGLILQWAKQKTDGNSSGALTTFPIAFPHAVLFVAPIDNAESGGGVLGSIAWGPTSSSLSQAFITVSSGNTNYSYFALGY